MTLKTGDINYLTALSPGDYFIVNILEDENRALRVYDRALAGKSINRPQDGFRGLYRVQSVHKTTSVEPQTGRPMVNVQVTGYSFVELNDVVYFNPYLLSPGERDSEIFFLTSLSDQWNKILGIRS